MTYAPGYSTDAAAGFVSRVALVLAFVAYVLTTVHEFCFRFEFIGAEDYICSEAAQQADESGIRRPIRLHTEKKSDT